ncbi:MAG: CinA family nicotinamide mononucleotide deamidase-related protein [Planctomycetaceae bacterium]|nr:CinA family nicotinamide mononucleotide deamidase-related protein [Planctomycetaceae bacterium]
MQIAELISIGDELTCGKILDTNQQWLSRHLTDLGVRVLYHSTVGDEISSIVDALRIATNRANLVFCSGGLGPTADDLTRQAIAELLDVPLIQNAEMLETIRAMFKRRGREMPESNGIQACLPQGGVFIPNPHGTAPGIEVKTASGAMIFAFPGVPAEMKEMWNQTVQQRVCDLTETQSVIKIRTIHTFGQGESRIETMLPHLIDRDHYPRVGITADEATVTLRIVAEEETEEMCDAVIEPVAKLIGETLGDLVYGENEQTLADVVCEKLRKERKTLATLEWGTGGLLARTLTVSKSADGCFLGGVTVQSGEMLARLTGVSPDLDAENHDIENLVAVLALQWREQLSADQSLVIGPYPGNDPDQDDASVVWVGTATKDDVHDDTHGNVRVASFPYAGHPALIDIMTVKRALNFLRLA